MTLILAEKPELGRAIAAALPGAGRSEEGVIYKGDYAVCWAYGHLLTLKEPEDYDPAYRRWSLSALPLYFEDWGHKPREDARGGSSRARLAQIGALLRRCEAVIHAGDPDDEGQYLIDEILRWHRCRVPVWRMNTNDTTPAALRRALTQLRDNRAFEARGWSAHARSVADLVVGVNCSRCFTLKNPGTLLTIGRVQTATLGLVVLRDQAIEGHVRQTYFELTAQLEIEGRRVEAQYTPRKDDEALEEGRILSRSYAEEKAEMLRGLGQRSVGITRREISEPPPLPFNLTQLQSYCSAKFGYEPTQVLSITQTLRDKYHAITYNRSDCQYLSEEQFKTAPQTLSQVCRNIDYTPRQMDPARHSRCFDDSRVSAHTAIIPQNTALDLARLTEAERRVYLAICKYYLAQFLPPARKARTSLSGPLPDGARLSASATEVLEPGYLALFKGDKAAGLEEAKGGALCSLPPGNYLAQILGARVDEKQTKPPARYTKASLCKDMTRIARYVTDPEVKRLLLEKDRDKEGENGSIGTVATRGPIIDKLVERGYFQEEGKKLRSTPLGRELYRILPDELKKPDMTARWWALQEDIQQGAAPWESLPRHVLEMVRGVLATDYPRVDLSLIPPQYRREKSASAREVLGKCPRCGGDVVEGKKGFGCANYKSGCHFVIWKRSKLPLFSKLTVSKANVKTWLSAPWRPDPAHSGQRLSGRGIHSRRLLSKSGKLFPGTLYLRDDPDSSYGPNLFLKL